MFTKPKTVVLTIVSEKNAGANTVKKINKLLDRGYTYDSSKSGVRTLAFSR